MGAKRKGSRPHEDREASDYWRATIEALVLNHKPKGGPDARAQQHLRRKSKLKQAVRKKNENDA